MTGFIYIWYDRKHKRFYIGSHWGTEDDGYICSSRWMRKAYRRRPQDFKRRIIKRHHGSYQELIKLEDCYLRTIKTHELGIRYYNRQARAFGNSWDDNIQRQKIAEATQKANKGLITVRYPDQDKFFRVSKNDPRWLNGELINARGRKRNPRTKKGYMKGENHYNFTGYFHTPWGKFITAQIAADNCPYGHMGHCTIIRWCKSKNDEIFTPSKRGQPSKIIQPEWLNKTRKEVGFWFEKRK